MVKRKFRSDDKSANYPLKKFQNFDFHSKHMVLKRKCKQKEREFGYHSLRRRAVLYINPVIEANANTYTQKEEVSPKIDSVDEFPESDAVAVKTGPSGHYPDIDLSDSVFVYDSVEFPVKTGPSGASYVSSRRHYPDIDLSDSVFVYDGDDASYVSSRRHYPDLSDSVFVYDGDDASYVSSRRHYPDIDPSDSVFVYDGDDPLYVSSRRHYPDIDPSDSVFVYDGDEFPVKTGPSGDNMLDPPKTFMDYEMPHPPKTGSMSSIDGQLNSNKELVSSQTCSNLATAEEEAPPNSADSVSVFNLVHEFPTLELVKSSSGVVFGRLDLSDEGGGIIHCGKLDVVSHISSHAKFLLFVEDVTPFVTLCTEIDDCIIITSKGECDSATRLLFKKIQMECGLPVFAFINWNPKSMEMLSYYVCGSDDIRFLVPVRDDLLLPMTDDDIKTCEYLMKQNFIMQNPAIATELNLMFQRKMKMETQMLELDHQVEFVSVSLHRISEMADVESQIAVHDDCKRMFMDLKTKRTFRFIIYKIEKRLKLVKVVVLGKPAETYDDFTACLPAHDCRYAVFDYDFLTPEGVQKSRIFFIVWSPDSAKERSKMIYASSKDKFKRELDGIQVELQATDVSELGLDVIQSRAN